MSALKEMFNIEYFKHLAKHTFSFYPSFNVSQFIAEIEQKIEPLSLNERMRMGCQCLKKQLPKSEAQTISIFNQVIPLMSKGYTNLIFPEYIALFHKDINTALDALAFYTCFGSSEFAVRHFLNLYWEQTFPFLIEWSKSPNEHLRRLASEASRPHLPWSMKLKKVAEDPNLTFEILNQLKEDKSLYVKKSVANHLNDISKNHPEWLIQKISHWDFEHPNTKWIIKHGLRTLIKNGNLETLKLLGIEIKPLEIKKMHLFPKVIEKGSALHFEVEIYNPYDFPMNVIVDYKIHYLKQNKKHSSKVFKWKSFEIEAKSQILIKKKQLFKDFSTRKLVEGLHYFQLQVNGQLFEKIDWTLV
jgi:3-methyladenine DNA glycosylase AlkC